LHNIGKGVIVIVSSQREQTANAGPETMHAAPFIVGKKTAPIPSVLDMGHADKIIKNLRENPFR